MTEFREGEYVIAVGHNALMRVGEDASRGKVRLEHPGGGTIDVWRKNVRRLKHGDLLTFGGMEAVHEVLGKRQSDGWYLISKPGDTGVSFHLDPAYRVMYVSADQESTGENAWPNPIR